MPPEPKRPIEELLEASARARRAEFGPEAKMPNPTRVRLHEEIARRATVEDASERRGSWLAAFWPKLSLATAVAAVLITGIVFWSRERNRSGEADMRVAMQAPAAAPEDPAAALRSLDAPAAEALAKGESKALAAEPAFTEADRFADAATASAPEVASAPMIAESRREETTGEVASAAPAAAAPAAAPTIVARSFVQQAPQSVAATGNVQQRFSQDVPGRARAAAKRKQDASILNTFDIQQEGERIRVVDEDGSTYTGKLEAGTEERAKVAARRAPAVGGVAAPESGAVGQAPSHPKSTSPPTPTVAESNEFRFRAEGFNTRLQKQVVFEGNYIASPAEEETPQQQRQTKDQRQAPARVIGRANVAGEPPIEVDAIAVSR